MDKSIGSIIDTELAKIEQERKRLEKQREKLVADLGTARTSIKAMEKELGTTEACITEITRERGRVIKRALTEAGISLDPSLKKPRASGGPGSKGLRNGAPKDVLAFIVSKGTATTQEVAEHFATADFVKRLPVILSSSLKAKGYLTAERAAEGRGSIFTATPEGTAAVG